MTHPTATCELCGDTGLYSPSAVPCPKGCKDIDRNGEILLRDLQQFKDKPVGSIRIDMSDVRSILKMADQITNMLAYIAGLEQRETDAREKSIEALKPFAEYRTADGMPGHSDPNFLRMKDDHPVLFKELEAWTAAVIIGDFRRAKALYEALKDEVR